MRRLLGIVVLFIGALSGSPARGVEKEAIDKAVERGIAGLRAMQAGDGSWPPPIGATALAGVTLLECDVDPTDPAIQKAAEAVRREVISTPLIYPICTSIFFLDRLGDPKDIPLLEALTVRLMSGQIETGGYHYNTPPVPEDEKKRLTDYYESVKGKKVEPFKGRRTVADLAPESKLRLASMRLQSGAGGAQLDHSNTQFATLALWVGRRQGVPTDRSLELIDKHYRINQNADGGWGYFIGNEPNAQTRASMIPSGILGLSVAQGVVLSTGRAHGSNIRPSFDEAHDATLRKALARLSLEVADPPSKTKAAIPKLKGTDVYFLWSLERIMVAMDKDRLGGKDWYNWGAEILIANQDQNGRWPGAHSQCGADTCFALLFLRKANLAGDLTSLLKKDFVLKAGGPGDRGPKPPVDPVKPPMTETGTAKTPGEATPMKPPPPAETRPTFTQPRSAGLAEKLVKATSAGQADLLDQMRAAKGVEYTEALAGAIPQLSGETKRKARDVLAERLTRMKADTLSHYLKDDDVEIRRAAALASGTREFKDQVPQLIELLNDADQGVVLAAHTALKSMTGQKIGPSPEPWRTWWKQQEKK